MTESGKNLLLGKMASFGEKQAVLANIAGLSLSRLNAKLNNYCGAEFTQTEISAIKSHYGLNSDEVDAIFFGE